MWLMVVGGIELGAAANQPWFSQLRPVIPRMTLTQSAIPTHITQKTFKSTVFGLIGQSEGTKNVLLRLFTTHTFLNAFHTAYNYSIECPN